MSTATYALKTSTLIALIVGSLLIGGLIGGTIGFAAAPSGGEDFDLPEMDAFRMGFIPAAPENQESVKTNAEALTDFLEARLNIPIEIYPVSSGYEDLILAFEAGQLDAAFLDGTPSHFVVEGGNAEVVLAELRSANNAPFYNAAAWVRADSPYNTIEDLIGNASDVITSHTSMTGTAGMVMPMGSLIADGLVTVGDNNDTDSLLKATFEDYIAGGGYGEALRRVLDNEADVAFVRDSTPADVFPDRVGELKMIHVFGKAPSHPIVVSTDLAEGWKFKFVNAMLELNDPENIEILQDLYGAAGLVGANNLHIEDISRAVSQLPWLEETILSDRG